MTSTQLPAYAHHPQSYPGQTYNHPHQPVPPFYHGHPQGQQPYYPPQDPGHLAPGPAPQGPPHGGYAWPPSPTPSQAALTPDDKGVPQISIEQEKQIKKTLKAYEHKRNLFKNRMDSWHHAIKNTDATLALAMVGSTVGASFDEKRVERVLVEYDAQRRQWKRPRWPAWCRATMYVTEVLKKMLAVGDPWESDKAYKKVLKDYKKGKKEYDDLGLGTVADLLSLAQAVSGS